MADVRAARVQTSFLARLDSLYDASVSLEKAAAALPGDSARVTATRVAFNRARVQYKRLEYLLEYTAPISAMELNGAAVPQVNLDEGRESIFPPTGFQVVEGLLYPTLPSAKVGALRTEIQNLRERVDRARDAVRENEGTDAKVFDALRIEIARICTLGIVGFDSPVRRASMSEARAAIDGVREALTFYQIDLRKVAPAMADSLARVLRAADANLSEGTFDSFDRLRFIALYANPLARAIAAVRDALKIPVPLEERFWRASAATLFQRDAFDVDAVRPLWAPRPTPPRVALGRQLFFDPILTGGGRTCATCHDPKHAFTDGLATSTRLTPGTRLRNTPTLINAGLQTSQFSDMRAPFLEDQVAIVVHSQAEMGSSLEAIVGRVKANPDYVKQFQAAFAGLPDAEITTRSIRMALAAYVRSLIALDSRADRAMNGNLAALTAEERRGFNLFTGKAACATCHFIPLTNGAMPPVYMETEQEVIGVPAAPVWQQAHVDDDSGRAGVTHASLHRFAFKPPTLRNVALTAPYMHNGVYRTLEEVVRFYNGGGGAGIGINLPNQTLGADGLRLTDAEQRALIMFMRALTDTVPSK
ncbi:MAG TPA: cytochrome c peroxidase [Gemmatimonadaceae bacterium]|nr:cytochrome c peroxidase [Gemmatimonadaceae bacterium]